MRELDEIRKDLDAVDSEICDLFAKRMDLSCEVAEYKMATGKPVFDQKREREKLESIVSGAGDAFLEQGIRELFSQLMSMSRKKQYSILAGKGRIAHDDFFPVKEFSISDVVVVYQGVEGAYSQMAAHTFFGKDVKAFHVKTWRDAMEALSTNKADYAVLPIENSTAGSVVENYDLLMEFDAAIIGEQIIEIEHALLGLPGASLSDIRTVYSHPQAIMQCDGYLQKHPEINAISVENTAMAAKKVKDENDPTQAAIAGEINADLYGLSILEQSIQDVKGNRTRFLIIANRHLFREDAEKVSICFELPHQTGSLYQSLSHIIFNGLNMTMIESRPIRKTQWQYRFFVDFQGNLKEEATQNALMGLREETIGMRILGNY